MLRRLIGEDLDLVASLDPSLGNVKVDPGQVEQVLLNLAVNARDAMPEGGRLTIETRNADLDESYARQHLPVRPGPYVMLAVSDTGIGMSEEIKAHLFEPFFTTKELGKGTGLGLSTVYGIVKQSGGNIWVYSEPGQGTTFKIFFPRVEEPAQVLVGKAAPPLRTEGTETLLLVEDSEAVRKLARDVLRARGYSILEARTGKEAIEVASAHKGPFDLLLTDIVMPEMSGRALATYLSAARPGLKVVYISGYSEDAVVHHGVLDRGTPFLSKPFTPYDLARKVREVLDGPQTQPQE
jgi:two-component system cell cycle sensor histidine kinase/response regulator CckA